AGKATCPAGHTSATWNPVVSEGIPKTVVSFAALDCIPCPFKPQCTTAKKNRRQLSLHPRQMTEALRHTRTRQKTKDWNTDYALRSGIEGTIRQATAVTDTRRARYRGLAKTHLEHIYSAVALNLIRLNAWWNDRPLDRTRTS
ncbi:transposase, partial [Streptomyces sp. 110]|nr:transposase [Streptomyces endocoffeicus]